MTQPTILTVTASVSRQAGGVLDAVRDLARATHALGVREVVFGGIDPHTAADLPPWAPVEVRLLPVSGPPGIGWMPGIEGDIARIAKDASSPCVLSLHGLWMLKSLHTLRASKRLSLPVVVHPHGMLEPYALRISAWKKRLVSALFERENLRRAACLRALCLPELEHIRLAGYRNPVAVVTNGVDASAYANLPEPARGAELFPELANRPVLLFLSRLHPKKGLPSLLEAWSRIERKDWLLAIAGPDQLGHRAELEAQVQGLGLGRDVRFLGPVSGERKLAALALARGLVLPSRSEGFPMTLLEAAICRVPVVQTRACNFPELAAAGGAIECEPDVDSLVKALRGFLERSDAERSAMGEAGYRLVKERYTWEEVARRMVAVYAWVAGDGPAPESVVMG